MEYKHDLDRNENNYGPAPRCFEVLKAANRSHLSCYTKAFASGVKSILSERLAKEVRLPESRVLLGYGAEDLLKQAIQCYVSPGQKLFIPSYSWWYYKELAGEVGGINIEYPLEEGSDSFHYNVDALLRLCRQEKPQAVLISSPNNPTGNSISLPDLKSVLGELRETVVILDQAYAFDGFNDHLEILLNDHPNLILVRTFSKYFALAGLRIGFALVGENIQKLTRSTNRYLGFNRLSEEAAVAALDSPDYYRTISDKMNKDKELYYAELGRLKGFKVFRSDANFILVKIPSDIIPELKKFLQARGLFVKFMNEERLRTHLRITLGTQEENRAVVRAIQEFTGIQPSV